MVEGWFELVVGRGVIQGRLVMENAGKIMNVLMG